jgi:TonB family protein
MAAAPAPAGAVPAGAAPQAAPTLKTPPAPVAKMPVAGTNPSTTPPPAAPQAAPAAPAAKAETPRTTLPYSSYISSHRIAGAEPKPTAALRSQVAEAHVLAHICVGTDGSVTDVRIVRASPGFEDPVKQAVTFWRYRPFMSQGHAIPVCFDMPFEFKRQ